MSPDAPPCPTPGRPGPAASSSATPSAASAASRSPRCSRRSRPGPARSTRSRPKAPHLPAKAKSVIFLFMAGGPSHLETFDPKPLLNKLNGQVRPKEFGEAKYQFVQSNARLLGTKRTFQKYGQSGIEVSDLFPLTAECVDDLAVIRSCPRRHGRPLGRAVRAVHRPGHAGLPEHRLVGPLRAGVGEPVAAVLRRDARPEGGARGRPADVRQRLPAGRLPADHVPPRRPSGAQPRPPLGRRARAGGGGPSSSSAT